MKKIHVFSVILTPSLLCVPGIHALSSRRGSRPAWPALTPVLSPFQVSGTHTKQHELSQTIDGPRVKFMASRMGKFSATKFSDGKTLFLVPKQSFLTRNKVFRPETMFPGQKQSFLIMNKVFRPNTKFSHQKQSFLTRNKVSWPETKFWAQKQSFLLRNKVS